jgi:signal transduction histidine kinase
MSKAFEFPQALNHEGEKPAFTGFDPGHVVRFYDDEGFLAGAVAEFLAAGFVAGQPAVVIATKPRRDAFAHGLKAAGVDVDVLLTGGQLTMLDARETLSAFMAGGQPDARRFSRIIGSVLTSSQLRGAHPCTRAYGEMVDLLWKDGNAEGAIHLEELWNALAKHHRFALVCAYSMGNFHREADGRQFEKICRQHSHVVPTETYMEADVEGRLREVTRLQQRARALEHALEHRQHLEAALRESLRREQEARLEAERANRVKDDFLAVLSHELRTPLNAILGWTQIIKSECPEASAAGRGLEVITRNAELQTRLIDDLLDMSRIVRGQLRIASDVVDLGATLGSTVESVRPAIAAKRIELDLEMDRSVVQVRGDAGRLHQIVWNLLSNAVKFTPAAGRVSVRLERAGTSARIVVQDTGQGIRSDFLPHVFDRFRQGDDSPTRRHGGLGLGLAVVRHLVEAHGGTVTAESEGEGCGATFTVTLPLRHILPRDAPGRSIAVNGESPTRRR